MRPATILRIHSIISGALDLAVRYEWTDRDDEDGSLVGPEPLAWRPHALPSAGSFTDGTVCPNTLTYKDNTAEGKTIAQMMEAPNPPTNWVLVGKLRSPRRSAVKRALSGILPGLSGRRSFFAYHSWARKHSALHEWVRSADAV
jgi:hypothetical protein